MLFTFFVEWQGSTLVEQFESTSLGGALRRWNRESSSSPAFEQGKLEGPNSPTAVSGCRNVWCFTGVDGNDIFFMVHIVLTQ